ncbi:voltage-dependent anion channel-domain-containing protein [Microdochium trichocladiopsis]|uniref:Voltage-dependent anion channel-domain-containing protein n=1 Tax=Microdochium trichocladiopsis TaxID=1682393 RepID=A0A9P8YGR3_9PEZI|nr:voltage-dependent anion channel-domain-containing protein [Microdochium trichocladiopsis]KAH7040221.1 voltage-dependent anion channel-domain-containing protein [Microdochium trichocladiopsis]
MSRVLSPAALDAAATGYITPSEECSAAEFPFSTARDTSGFVERRVAPKCQHAPAPADSLARMLSHAYKHKPGSKVSLRDRICCYQWTWFTMTMATGGIANALHAIWTGYQTNWLYYIGLAYFLLNLTLFVMNCVLISLRFAFVSGSFINSFRDQFESLFIPAVVVSMGTILINSCEYGIPRAPWLAPVMVHLYWIYIAVSMFASAGMYLILWSTQIFPIHTMTPVWVFPAYPLLLTAPLAGNLIYSATLHGSQAEIPYVALAFSAVSVQGAGFLISFMICAAFIYRLMTQKLPRDMQRPGVFISIGPGGFTVAGIVLLGQLSDHIIPAKFQGEEHAVFIVRILSVLIGLWLWGLSFWFFLVSVGSLWKYLIPGHRLPFQMTWWSFVFPNTALVTATLQLATALDSPGFRVFGCVMAACLVVVWIAVFATMIHCLVKKQLLWPEQASDD